MKEKDNKELIERMVATLRDHAAPYKEGAWERFAASQGKGKKITPIWYLSGAAAMVLLGVALLINSGIFDRNNAVMHKEYTQTQVDDRKTDLKNDALAEEYKKEDDQEATDNSQSKSTVLAFTQPKQGGTNSITKLHQTVQTEQLNNDNREQVIVGAVEKEIQTDTPGQEVVADDKEKTPQLAERRVESKEDALMRMLSEESAYASSPSSMAQKNEHIGAKKWNVGVMFAPSLTEERVNMGGGVTVAYQISEKVSIGSGVSLVDLGLRQSSPNTAGNGNVMDSPAPASLSNQSPMFNARSVETKELTSINTNLLALDIPVDIKYQVSKQFYASAGVSFFAVLNENRTNNFLTRTPTDRTLQSAEGLAVRQPEFQIKNVSEKSAETPYQGNGYSGFLNFSVGRKMPISNKVGIAVEPFIKIPVGTLSNQDMNLRYGGVRVITSF